MEWGCSGGGGGLNFLSDSKTIRITFFQVPDSILKAAPSADLWDGQSDEEELGFAYDFIELFVGHYLKLSENDQVSHTLRSFDCFVSHFETNPNAHGSILSQFL